jgi:ribosomal protein S8
MENDELEELKEISIAKIKVAYNRSIDAEATHMTLWNRSEKRKKLELILTLILSIIATSSIIFTINLALFTEFGLFIFIADIFSLLLMCLIIWEIILMFTGKSIDHGHIVNEAFQLREQSMSFLQYKLDNLDKQGYIDELKSLEQGDAALKERSAKYTKKLSNNTKSAIKEKITDLERHGIKVYFMTQEEVDSATEKLQKYTALRTCEAWIKFE